MFKIHIFLFKPVRFSTEQALTEPYVSEKRHRMDEQHLESGQGAFPEGSGSGTEGSFAFKQ